MCFIKNWCGSPVALSFLVVKTASASAARTIIEPVSLLVEVVKRFPANVVSWELSIDKAVVPPVFKLKASLPATLKPVFASLLPTNSVAKTCPLELIVALSVPLVEPIVAPVLKLNVSPVLYSAMVEFCSLKNNYRLPLW